MSALRGLAELDAIGRLRNREMTRSQGHWIRSAQRQALIASWSGPQYLADEQARCAAQGRLWYSAGFRCI